MIFTHEQLESTADGQIPPWGLPSVNELLSTLSDENFPCTYAINAIAKRSLHFCFKDRFDGDNR